MKVVLNKNSWHRKLQGYVLGKPEEFPNLCPYFWLTVFCMLVSPYVALWRYVLYPLCRGLALAMAMAMALAMALAMAENFAR